MKKLFILFCCCFINNSATYSQPIPYGNSVGSITTSDGIVYDLSFYKPANYDSTSSPLLWAIFGVGVNPMRVMADNRGALLLVTSGLTAGAGITEIDTIITPSGNDSIIIHWVPKTFKDIYRHIIARENRDTMWVHLTGFSLGGQTITRYMLLRQAFPDSIPIRMAVSGNPNSYTFCTDVLNGVCMPWYCGIGTDYWGDYQLVDFICNEHVIAYYNENYGVLIGTADNGGTSGGFGGCLCVTAQGNGRYERAQNFYAFSDTDAVNRGTSLKWQYAEVPGVAHDGNLMYSVADTADTVSIAEHLLFDSPYYPPVFLPPSADFSFEVSDIYCNEVSFNAHCTFNKFPASVYWDFGDGYTSTIPDPVHSYTGMGTYTVTLIITNSLGGDTMTQNITINNLSPKADFTTNTTVAYLPNATVQFYNNSIFATDYYWDFGDSTANVDTNPLHTYLWEDTFTVQLIATNGFNGCIDELIKSNYIIVTNCSNFTANFTQSKDTVDLALSATVQFTDSSNAAQWLWDFGDGDTDAVQNPSHIYDSVGTYTVTLIASNGICSDTAISTVVVVSSSGIEEYIRNPLKIYPNPNTGQFTLEMDLQKNTSLSIQLYQITGQQIFAEKFNNLAGFYSQQIDLSKYAKGMYYVQIVTDRGVFVKKLIYQ